MDALKLERAILAGFDWGARTANVIAALWPERCTGLVSVSGYLIGSQEANQMPLPPPAELTWWYQFYFATARGRAGYDKYRHDFNKLIWKLASPKWAFDDATFDRTAASFDNNVRALWCLYPSLVSSRDELNCFCIPICTQTIKFVEPARLLEAPIVLGCDGVSLGPDTLGLQEEVAQMADITTRFIAFNACKGMAATSNRTFVTPRWAASERATSSWGAGVGTFIARQLSFSTFIA